VDIGDRTLLKRPALIAFTCLIALDAREAAAQPRPAIVQSVDLQLPRVPETIDIAGQTHIVYELHITNFQAVDVAIRHIQILDDAGPNAVLASYADSAAIAGIVARPGRRRDQAPAHILEPGTRAIAYFWIAIPHNAPVPRAIRHRVAMDVLRSGGGAHTVIDGAVATVRSDAPVALDPPLRGGLWVAIYDPHLMGGHRTAIYTTEGRARIPGRFAIDWVRLPRSGVLENVTPRPADWNGYGADVLAVADAVVAGAMDDMPDNVGEPGASAHRPENASGNYVALDLGQGDFAFYEHLKHGSVMVKTGDRVRRGQVIARLGNSGSSSMGPHLHFHVSDTNSLLAAEGTPFVLRQFKHLGAFPSIAALLRGEKWVAASAREIRLERPAANSVVVFP
jgi:hypothetical protein